MLEALVIILTGFVCTLCGVIYIDRRINYLIAVAFSERCTMCRFRAYADKEIEQTV